MHIVYVVCARVCAAHVYVYTHQCTYTWNDQHFTESDVHRQYFNKATGFPKWMHKLTPSQPHMSLSEIPHPSQHVAFSDLNHHQSDECVIIHCCSWYHFSLLPVSTFPCVYWEWCCLVVKLCLTLCSPMDCSLPGSSVWDSPGKNTGVGCHFLFQGIFPTQG